jgi:hypothetical protein
MTATTRKITAGQAGSRWGFLSGIDIGADGDPYLDRLRILETPWLAVYLHHIHREDRDPDPHDHPWGFISLVLAGSYIERVWPDKRKPVALRYLRLHERFTFGFLGRKSAHLITTIEAPLWTLVITGPRRGDWGFWEAGRFVHWREYIGDPAAGLTAGRRGRHEDLPHPNDFSQEIR